MRQGVRVAQKRIIQRGTVTRKLSGSKVEGRSGGQRYISSTIGLRSQLEIRLRSQFRIDAERPATGSSKSKKYRVVRD
jgi:hypothetical protein